LRKIINPKVAGYNPWATTKT